MTKREIFIKIAEICAIVCDVDIDELLNGCRKEDVVIARVIMIFWCDSAGFSVESLLSQMDKNNANSINSIKARTEELWSEKFAFHMLVAEVGHRLRNYAQSIGEDFDVMKPLRHMSKVTGKY